VGNLVDNAVRHAPPGSAVTLVAAVPAPGRVLIDVADEGPGFPPDFLAHAFERFHRAESARSRDDGGTGLGLSIVRAIARAHGGEARVANRPGRGAVVTIELPTGPPLPRTAVPDPAPATAR
jgi:two-component system, OmpR family, sensor kinase